MTFNTKHDQYIQDAVGVIDPTTEAILKSRTADFDDNDYPNFNPLMGESLIHFVQQYKGNNMFLNSVKKRIGSGRGVTIKQLRAVANVARLAFRGEDMSEVHGAPKPGSPLPPPVVLQDGQAFDVKPENIRSEKCFTCNKWVVGDYGYLMNEHKPRCARSRQAETPAASGGRWDENGSKNTRNVERQQPKRCIDLRGLPERGRFAINLANGETKFYLIERAKRRRTLQGRFNWSKYPSRHAVSYEPGDILVREQSGDTKQFIGCQLTSDDFYIGEQEDHIAQVMEAPEGAMVLYGQLIGACAYCGRSLTDDESRQAGIGPDCMENKHIPRLRAMGERALAARGL